MSKFSITKEVKEKMQVLYTDMAFHERAIKRIDTEMNALLVMELKRTGSLDKEVKNIDLEKGEIEVGDIIKKPSIEIAKK